MKQKISNLFQRINNIKYASFIFLLFSSLLSASMFLRLHGAALDWVKYANIIFYVLTYAGGSVVALAYFLLSIDSLKRNPDTNRYVLILPLTVLFIICAILFLGSAWGFLPEYIFQTLPVLFAYLVYIAVSRQKPRSLKTKFAALIGLVLVISILLPNITAYACKNDVLSQAENLSTPEEKVTLIAGFVRNTSNFNIFRSYNDFWKYLLVGTGVCLEIAVATQTLLNEIEFKARKVSLPGEDHAFVEVKINGTWFVVDPGYSIVEPITREQRAAKRITEFGAISYVITQSGSSFIELTQYYVPTDTLIIRVTKENEPLANAQVYLKHQFMSRTLQIPSSDTTFFTDTNGEITFKLGALAYNENASEYESYYWIYVNDKNTGQNVTSNGTGALHEIEIKLPK